MQHHMPGPTTSTPVQSVPWVSHLQHPSMAHPAAMATVNANTAHQSSALLSPAAAMAPIAAGHTTHSFAATPAQNHPAHNHRTTAQGPAIPMPHNIPGDSHQDKSAGNTKLPVHDQKEFRAHMERDQEQASSSNAVPHKDMINAAAAVGATAAAPRNIMQSLPTPTSLHVSMQQSNTQQGVTTGLNLPQMQSAESSRLQHDASARTTAIQQTGPNQISSVPAMPLSPEPTVFMSSLQQPAWAQHASEQGNVSGEKPGRLSHYFAAQPVSTQSNSSSDFSMCAGDIAAVVPSPRLMVTMQVGGM